MTQIIACAVVSVFTSLLSGQVQGQKDLQSLCNELFPQDELERLGYSISYKSEGATDFAEVEDGGRKPRLSFAYGDQLKIQLHDLGLTLFNPTTGKQDDEFPWRARLLESVNASTPIIVDDMVFISEILGPFGKSFFL